MPAPIQGPGATHEAFAQRPVEPAEVEPTNVVASGRSFFSEILISGRRHWKMVVTVWAVVFVGTTAYALSLVPRYSSVGVLQVSSKDGMGAGNPVTDLLMGSGSEVQTEVEIVKRRELLLSAAHAIKLAVRQPEKNTKYSTDMDVTLLGKSPVDPRLTAVRSSLAFAQLSDRGGREQVFVLRVTGERDYELDLLKDNEVTRTLKGRVGETIEENHLVWQLRERPLEIGSSIKLVVVHDSLVLEEIHKSLSVRALGLQRKPTNLVEIKFTEPSRDIAQSFVQALMERYLSQSLDWQSLRASRSAEFLTERIEDIKQRLEDDEESLRTFSEHEQAAGLEFQAKVTVEESARLRAEASKIDMKLDIVDSARKRLRSRLKSGGGMASLTATFFEDPVLLASVGQLTAKETKQELLRATYHDTHPLVLRVQREVEQEKRAVLKLLATARRNLKSQKRELEQGIDKLEQRLTGFPHKELELARRTRDLEVSQRLYSFLLEKKNEAEIVKASTTTDKRVIDNASFPLKPTSPKRVKIVGMGFLGGFLLGLLGAFQLRFFRRRVESVERIREFLDIPVYGTIPALESMKKVSKKSGQERRTNLNPDSLWKDHQTPVTEAIRSLCVNVGMIPKTPGRARVIQVTSSESREGKSTVLSNLAVALRRSGASVLVVDLDLRKPTQHRIWSCPRSPGFTDLIASGCQESGDASEFFQQVGKDRISLLTAGSKAPETLTVLMHEGVSKLFELFASQFDYVLIDSPPFFVADSSVISQHADLLLVAARPGLVERSSLLLTAHGIARCNLPKGLVFNAVEGRHHDSQYYGSYSGYGYGYAYTDYATRTYASESDQDAA